MVKGRWDGEDLCKCHHPYELFVICMLFWTSLIYLTPLNSPSRDEHCLNFLLGFRNTRENLAAYMFAFPFQTINSLRAGTVFY